eukprot:75185-Prorocentrum_minimum.AAC.1
MCWVGRYQRGGAHPLFYLAAGGGGAVLRRGRVPVEVEGVRHSVHHGALVVRPRRALLGTPLGHSRSLSVTLGHSRSLSVTLAPRRPEGAPPLRAERRRATEGEFSSDKVAFSSDKVAFSSDK